MNTRFFSYDIVLGSYKGAKIAGPRVMSGPRRSELDQVHAAMDAIAEVAEAHGLRLKAVVLANKSASDDETWQPPIPDAFFTMTLQCNPEGYLDKTFSHRADAKISHDWGKVVARDDGFVVCQVAITFPGRIDPNDPLSVWPKIPVVSP